MEECELIRLLREAGLRIVIEQGAFTDPNDRIVKLKVGDETLSETSFSVVQRDEYEG